MLAWTNIPGATGTNLATGILCAPDDPAQYRAIGSVSLLGGAMTSSATTDVATITVLPDLVAPTVVSVGSHDGNSVGVRL